MPFTAIILEWAHFLIPKSSILRPIIKNKKAPIVSRRHLVFTIMFLWYILYAHVVWVFMISGSVAIVLNRTASIFLDQLNPGTMSKWQDNAIRVWSENGNCICNAVPNCLTLWFVCPVKCVFLYFGIIYMMCRHERRKKYQLLLPSTRWIKEDYVI